MATLSEADLIDLFFPAIKADVSEYIQQLLINTSREGTEARMSIQLANKLIKATELYQAGDDRGFDLYEQTIETIASYELADCVQAALIKLGSEIVVTSGQ
jgi:hypothetical protein